MHSFTDWLDSSNTSIFTEKSSIFGRKKFLSWSICSMEAKESIRYSSCANLSMDVLVLFSSSIFNLLAPVKVSTFCNLSSSRSIFSSTFSRSLPTSYFKQLARPSVWTRALCNPEMPYSVFIILP